MPPRLPCEAANEVARRVFAVELIRFAELSLGFVDEVEWRYSQCSMVSPPVASTSPSILMEVSPAVVTVRVGCGGITVSASVVALETSETGESPTEFTAITSA